MPEPITGEQGGPTDAAKKQEQEVKKSYDELYSELLKKEQTRLDAETESRATLEFDRVRSLGFTTQKDVDTKIEAIFSKFVNEVKNLREENTKLREWVMKAKAQGLNVGKLEEETKEESVLKAWERPFIKDLKK